MKHESWLAMDRTLKDDDPILALFYNKGMKFYYQRVIMWRGRWVYPDFCTPVAEKPVGWQDLPPAEKKEE